MTEKIDIAEILKDNPANTKLYSPLFGEVHFSHVGGGNIVVEHHGGISLFFSSGRFFDYDESEPLLFPSKEMRDWRKFAWKKGDVLVCTDGKAEVIFERFDDNNYTSFVGKHYIESYGKDGDLLDYEQEHFGTTANYTKESDETAQTYINTIEKRLGGKLNLDTLEIEKTQPEFKDGDIVALVVRKCTHIAIFQSRQGAYIGFHAVLCQNDELLLEEPFREDVGDIELRLATDSEKQQLFDAIEKDGKAWDAEKKAILDLKPKKSEFKIFQKVLVRNYNGEEWIPGFFFRIHNDGCRYILVCGEIYKQCIPYNDHTEHLLGTTDEWKGGEG